MRRDDLNAVHGVQVGVERPPTHPTHPTPPTGFEPAAADEDANDAGSDGFYTEAIPLDDSTQVHVTLAADDGAAPASLFAFSVWNGARRLARHLAQHPRLVQGRTIIEFGAAGALPSLAALRHGCRFALLTDFPSPPLLQAMERTLADPRNAAALGMGLGLEESSVGRHRRAAVLPHLWGEDTEPLLAALPDGAASRGFDVALVGECLWLHNQHTSLLKSIHGCLRPGGQASVDLRVHAFMHRSDRGSCVLGVPTGTPPRTQNQTQTQTQAFVSFSHHVPGCEAQDLAFFDLAAASEGSDGGRAFFAVEKLGEEPMPHAHARGRVAVQFLYRLVKKGGGDGDGDGKEGEIE